MCHISSSDNPKTSLREKQNKDLLKQNNNEKGELKT